MKHKLSMLVLALTVAFVAAADTWTDANTGYTWSYTLANGEATVTGVEPKSGTNLTIPDTLGDCPVTVIGGSAFKNNTGFTGTLTLPNSLKQVNYDSFGYCTGLTGLSFGTGVVSLSGWSFNGCTGLTALDIPANVKLDRDCFIDCTEIKTLMLAEGLETITGFSGCLGITQVKLPSTVTNIGENAFRGCRYMTNIQIPDEVVSLGKNAFNGCTALTRIKLPDSVETIGSETFSGCSGLTGTFSVPSSVKVLQSGVFSGCGSLIGISLPTCLERVERRAFMNCSSLISVVFPHGVCYVDARGLFEGCGSLQTVVFRSPVKTFTMNHADAYSDQMFFSCGSLRSVEIPEGVESLGALSGFGSSSSVYVFPSSLRTISPPAFGYFKGGTLIFKGQVSNGIEYIPANATVICPRSWGAKAQSVGVTQNFAGYYQTNAPTVTIISSAIRTGDPTILDVKYMVASSKSTVKVRALAFKDGTRSLANIVVPKSFVEDANGNATAGNVGDSVTANEEHTLSWKVSEDWQETLANVSFEVLAVEDDVLPLELTTIPGTTEHPATIQVSWNYITGDRVFDALLWLYADGDLGLTLSNGQLKHGDTTVASGTGNTGYDALVYVYSKMGYSLLQGDELTYAKNALRLNLPDVSTRQYAYKVISEE